MLNYMNIPQPASDTVNAKALSASTQETDTIPTGAKVVVMTASTLAYFRFGVNASIPSDTADGTASDTLPAGIPVVKAIPGTTVLGWVNATSTAMTVSSTDGLTVGTTITVKGADTAGADLSTTISAINQSTKVVTLGGAANTTVAGSQVIYAPTTLSVISAGTPTVTLAYYK